MENARAVTDVDEILRSLDDGLKQVEATMASLLHGILADNAGVLSELEAALTDVEAALANE
ncbi:MAG: hypothetical protein OEV40_21575 [Acidimicrobiia bacterium]|nr:hypothetical protein [Acidimicrobiia bacterium]